MRNKFHVAIFVFIIPLLFFGCTGGSANKELDTLKQKNSELEKEISSLKKTNSELQSKVTALETEKQNLSAEIALLQARIDELSSFDKTKFKNKLARAKEEIGLHIWLSKNVFTDNPTVSGGAALVETSKKLDRINNTVLNSEWDKFLACGEGQGCNPGNFMTLLLSEADSDLEYLLKELESE